MNIPAIDMKGVWFSYGKAPILKGLSVTACTRPEQADPDAWLEPSRTRRPDRWRSALGNPSSPST